MTEQRLTEQLQLVFTAAEDAQSSVAGGDAESVVAKREPERPAVIDSLMEAVCERDNLKKALRRVKANKGSPGIDGMTVEQLPDYLRAHWPQHREELLQAPIHRRRSGVSRFPSRMVACANWACPPLSTALSSKRCCRCCSPSSTRHSPTTATGFGRGGRHIRR